MRVVVLAPSYQLFGVYQSYRNQMLDAGFEEERYEQLVNGSQDGRHGAFGEVVLVDGFIDQPFAPATVRSVLQSCRPWLDFLTFYPYPDADTERLGAPLADARVHLRLDALWEILHQPVVTATLPEAHDHEALRRAMLAPYPERIEAALRRDMVTPYAERVGLVGRRASDWPESGQWDSRLRRERERLFLRYAEAHRHGDATLVAMLGAQIRELDRHIFEREHP